MVVSAGWGQPSTLELKAAGVDARPPVVQRALVGRHQSTARMAVDAWSVRRVSPSLVSRCTGNTQVLAHAPDYASDSVKSMSSSSSSSASSSSCQSRSVQHGQRPRCFVWGLSAGDSPSERARFAPRRAGARLPPAPPAARPGQQWGHGARQSGRWHRRAAHTCRARHGDTLALLRLAASAALVASSAVLSAACAWSAALLASERSSGIAEQRPSEAPTCHGQLAGRYGRLCGLHGLLGSGCDAAGRKISAHGAWGTAALRSTPLQQRLQCTSQLREERAHLSAPACRPAR